MILTLDSQRSFSRFYFSRQKIIDYFLWGLPLANPHSHGGFVYSVFFYNVLHDHFFSIYDRKNISFSIPALFFWTRPFAIFGGVWAVVVDSFQRKTHFWLVANVCDKITKICPSLANVYAASAITAISVIFWIFATLAHCIPSSVLWSKTGVVLHPFGTTATNPGNRQKLALLDRNQSAAVTSTMPVVIFSGLEGVIKHRKKSKTKADKLFFHRHYDELKNKIRQVIRASWQHGKKKI